MKQVNNTPSIGKVIFSNLDTWRGANSSTSEIELQKWTIALQTAEKEAVKGKS